MFEQYNPSQWNHSVHTQQNKSYHGKWGPSWSHCSVAEAWWCSSFFSLRLRPWGGFGEPMSWFMPDSGAIEGLRVTGGIQYSISLNKWCSSGLFLAGPQWGKWWRIGFLCPASFLIQMKSQEVHSSHFGDNEVVKLLLLCGHQELHLCSRLLCPRPPSAWMASPHRHCCRKSSCKPLCGEEFIVLFCYSTLEWKRTIKCA